MAGTSPPELRALLTFALERLFATSAAFAETLVARARRIRRRALAVAALPALRPWRTSVQPFITRGRRARPGVRLLAVAALLALRPDAASAETFVGPVIGVTDGDTLTVLRAGQPEVVRLRGIDAPERGQPHGDRARRHAAALAFGERVLIEAADRDRYGRLLAEVRLPDGRSLNQELVRAGYAWWFRRYSADPVLARLEADARRARRGLWADPRPTPPWEYRPERRSRGRPRRARDRAAPAVFLEGDSAPDRAPQLLGMRAVGHRMSSRARIPAAP